MIKNHCKIVMNSINDSIKIINKVENDPSHGLNIYFPDNSIDYNKDIEGGKLACFYENLKFSKETTWDEFIRSYLGVE